MSSTIFRNQIVSEIAEWCLEEHHSNFIPPVVCDDCRKIMTFIVMNDKKREKEERIFHLESLM